MQIQKVSNQNFGALKCKPSLNAVSMYIAEKSSSSKAIKRDLYLTQLEINKATTNLYLIENKGKKKLYAEVGNKLFKENFFNNPLRVLKKALSKSNEESQIELIANVIKILSKDFD